MGALAIHGIHGFGVVQAAALVLGVLIIVALLKYLSQ
jgi:hypothetical protein